MKIFVHFLLYWEALPHIWLCTRSHVNILIYEENFYFFFISVTAHIVLCLAAHAPSEMARSTVTLLRSVCVLVLWIRIRSRIQIRSDPKLFVGSGSGVGSGVGSGINHFGSGSGQPWSGINLKQNFSAKIHNFSTRLCILFPIRYHTDRINYLFQNNRLYISSFS